jgi:hypothetical protein
MITKKAEETTPLFVLAHGRSFILCTPWAVWPVPVPVLFHSYVSSHGRNAHLKLKVTGGRAQRSGDHTVPNHPVSAVLRIVLAGT